MEKSKKDPFLLAAAGLVGLVLLVGLLLVFTSLLSPFVYIFLAIMLPLGLGAVAEIRRSY